MFRIVVAIVFIILTLVVCRRAQKSQSLCDDGRVLWSCVLLWIFAIAWLCAVVYFAFLIRQPGDHGGINTEPFWEAKRAFTLLGPTILSGFKITSKALFMDIVLNILLFVPFGMIVPVLFQKLRRIWVVPLGLLCSFCIEGIQYLTALGMADVDDLINNTIGALLGFLIYLLFIRHSEKSVDD